MFLHGFLINIFNNLYPSSAIINLKLRVENHVRDLRLHSIFRLAIHTAVPDL